MKSKKSRYLDNYQIVVIEGFDQSKAINKIVHSNIEISDIRYVSTALMKARIRQDDLYRLREALGLNYRVTVERTWGICHQAKEILRQRTTIVGIAIFVLLVAIQSLFIMEIEIRGNENIDESQLREFLRDRGLKEGAFIFQDYGKLENMVADEYDRVVWIRIRHEGRYVLVDLAEGLENYSKSLEKNVDKGKPCDIVADKAGYIFDVQPYKGHLIADVGTYVNKGDVIISGRVPMESYAYGTDAEHQKEYYVHAQGDVLAKVPRNLIYITEKNHLKKTPTGQRASGLKISAFGKTIDMSQGKSTFKKSLTTETRIIKINFPLPLEISWKTNEEIETTMIPRSQSQLKKEAMEFINKWKSEKLGESSQISNKSLNFQPKENIIKVSIVLETVERIGKEKELILGDTKGKESNNR